MKIVINEEELEQHVVKLLNDLPDNKVLLKDHFLAGAIEAEADAICDGKDVYIIGMMEHIEPSGIHSGDSYAVLPTFDLSDDVIRQMEEHTKKIAVALKHGWFIKYSIRFIKDGIVYIIEANPRASRTVPLLQKAYDEPYVNYATKVMLGAKVKILILNLRRKVTLLKSLYLVMRNSLRFKKELGPEMKSTGRKQFTLLIRCRMNISKIFTAKRNLYLSK